MTRVPPNADPVSRCGACGHTYNPYRHAECPACFVDEGRGYYLGCEACGYDWLAPTGPNDKACPRCQADSRQIAEVMTP